jgi:hypothetical protein
MDIRVKDIAAQRGLVGLGVVEALADTDVTIGRIGAAVVLLPHLGADHLDPVGCRVEGRVVDDLELQGRDRRPHVQRADRGGLVFGVVVEFLNVDPQRAGGDLRRQIPVQVSEVVKERFVICTLSVQIVWRLIVDPPLGAGVITVWHSRIPPILTVSAS